MRSRPNQSRPNRWLRLMPAVVLALCLAGPAFAQDDDEEPGAFREFLSERGNNFKGGLNGMITWPADVMMVTDTEEIVPGWWIPFNYMTTFIGGTLQGVYRLTLGVLDVAFTPIPYFPMLSPVPRYKVIPFDHEDE